MRAVLGLSRYGWPLKKTPGALPPLRGCGRGLITVLKTPHRYLLLTIIALTTMILDQVVKLYIQQTMRLHETVVVIPGFFHLTYIRNPGAAFGLLASQGNGFRFVFFG